MAWTEDRVEELKKLWAEGHSGSEIAAKMGGVTRNTVLGKLHRLGLSSRAAPAKPKTVTTEARPTATAAPQGQPLRTVLRDLSPVTDFGTTKLNVGSIGDNDCRWPIGDPTPDDFHFCGQSCGPGKSYCAHHHGVAHTRAAKKKVRPAPPAYRRRQTNNDRFA